VMEDIPENELPLLPGETVEKDEICSIALGIRCVLTNFRFIAEFNPSFRELVQSENSTDSKIQNAKNQNPQKSLNFPEISLKPFRCSVPLTSINNSSPDPSSTELLKIKRKDASSVFLYFDSFAKAQVWSQAVYSAVNVNAKHYSTLTKTFAFVNREKDRTDKQNKAKARLKPKTNGVHASEMRKTGTLPRIELPEIKNLEISSSETSPSQVPLGTSPECSDSGLNAFVNDKQKTKPETTKTKTSDSKIDYKIHPLDRNFINSPPNQSAIPSFPLPRPMRSERRLSCIASPLANPNSPQCQPVTFFDQEMARLNFNTAHWRTMVNSGTINSSTYPDKFLAPRDLSDIQMVSVASHRSISRIPVPTWKPKNSDNVLLRSSQPLTRPELSISWGSKRNTNDEKLIELTANYSGGKKVAIIDCRPWKNALANVAKGGGYEHTEYYTSANPVHFANIDNIHAVRTSFEALKNLIDRSSFPSEQDYMNVKDITMNYNLAYDNLKEAEKIKEAERLDSLFTENDEFAGRSNYWNSNANGQRKQGVTKSSNLIEFHNLEVDNNPLIYQTKFIKPFGLCQETYHSELQATGWFNHLSSIIKCANLVRKLLLENKQSVLVHCSDGWDRTAQVTALSKLLCDPFYRSIKGFKILITTEWLNFGHKMADRNRSFGCCDAKDESSPIFLQFLDCCYQLIRQFPQAFQYNELVLLKLLRHTYSGLFGSFMCNNDTERRELCLANRTRTVFCLFDKDKEGVYKNPLYDPSCNHSLQPESHQRGLFLWKHAYEDFAPQLSKLATLHLQHTQKEALRLLHDHHVMNRVIEAMSDEIQECGETNDTLVEDKQFPRMSMNQLENSLNENDEDDIADDIGKTILIRDAMSQNNKTKIVPHLKRRNTNSSSNLRKSWSSRYLDLIEKSDGIQVPLHSQDILSLKHAWTGKMKQEEIQQEILAKYKNLEKQFEMCNKINKRKSSQDLGVGSLQNGLGGCGVSLSGSPSFENRVRNGHSIGSATTDGAESEPISESTEWIHILASEKD